MVIRGFSGRTAPLTSAASYVIFFLTPADNPGFNSREMEMGRGESPFWHETVFWKQKTTNPCHGRQHPFCGFVGWHANYVISRLQISGAPFPLLPRKPSLNFYWRQHHGVLVVCHGWHQPPLLQISTDSFATERLLLAARFADGLLKRLLHTISLCIFGFSQA